MAGRHELVAGGTAFGLRALRGQQVTETGCAADQLSGPGNLEALGNGLFGLLHGWSGRKQSTRAALARVLSNNVRRGGVIRLTPPPAGSYIRMREYGARGKCPPEDFAVAFGCDGRSG